MRRSDLRNQHCLPNVEKDGVQESKPQQKNQSAGLSSHGHVSAPVGGRDLVGNPARHQETEDFPNEIPLGHHGCDFL